MNDSASLWVALTAMGLAVAGFYRTDRAFRGLYQRVERGQDLALGSFVASSLMVGGLFLPIGFWAWGRGVFGSPWLVNMVFAVFMGASFVLIGFGTMMTIAYVRKFGPVVSSSPSKPDPKPPKILGPD